MYICDICNTAFNAPAVSVFRVLEDGHIRMDREALCPVCAAPLGDVEDLRADLCRCGEWKSMADHLCTRCRRELSARFRAFCDGLTAEEEAQLDDWLDGSSVTSREKFQ